MFACVFLAAAHASNEAKQLQEAQKLRANGDLAGALSMLRGITAKQVSAAQLQLARILEVQHPTQIMCSRTTHARLPCSVTR